MRASKLGLVPAGLFMLLFLANCAYVVYRTRYDPADSEFSGIGIVLLTLPWSMYLDPLTGPHADEEITSTLLRFSLYALLNAAVIYAVFAALAAFASKLSTPRK